MDVVIAAATPADAGEIMTVQRAAYLTEGQRYGDVTIPPLTETADEVRAVIAGGAVVLVARAGHRLAGSVRGHVEGRDGLVGRLAVAPDLQGHGIGGRLLRAVEEALAGRVDRLELFTGATSHDNVRLYERHGYVVFDHRPSGAGPGLVFLEKKIG
ncbi:GNAT family N-acetyltransferase [Spirilliplanes yamanashiensis]|uniref:GCN5 family acetyltransferase n=1 Tax=Spirilliplanes yamanashiensis TaxID=42233 RepID=A0A8J3Y596_9ACTN|nr:GNAT family N-acetyltransferase [Spirilliplanes yamanashiensis]MDP9819449.1 GNAT superfamily N-acetyltransferase [Spirilliplanes yamanashiensis]GIJ01729.1 GCN5 family acetyltransferase [Spirilliplanes yamanashiensis]